MKLLHLSDMHIGKRLYEVSLIEDQKYILEQILEITDKEKPDGIIIAGDIYDKSIPSAEAVEVFDDFLFSLSERKLKVFIISGNHDSPERIAFGSRIMCRGGIYLSPVYNGEITKIPLSDDVDIYMLPFVRPADVRRFYPDDDVQSYTDAVRVAIDHTETDPDHKNIIITHQFVTGASRCDSEDKSVGGTDNVDGSVFDKFDYVALGHIHGPQNVGTEKIRYCGSPLKYSFSESDHEKSVTIIEIDDDIKIRTEKLVPKHDLKNIKGDFEDVMKTESEDYVRIILTDDVETPDALERLRFSFPNILTLEYDNKRTRASINYNVSENGTEKSPFEIFSDFYEKMNGGIGLNSEQQDYMKKLIEGLTEEQI